MNWQQVYDAIPMRFGRKDEQILTQAFEDFVGGVSQARRLFNLYKQAKNTTSGNCFTLQKMPNTHDVFLELAQENGFTEEQAEALYSMQ